MMFLSFLHHRMPVIGERPSRNTAVTVNSIPTAAHIRLTRTRACAVPLNAFYVVAAVPPSASSTAFARLDQSVFFN